LLAAVTPAPQVMVVRAIKKIPRNRSVKQILNSQGRASAGQLPNLRIRRMAGYGTKSAKTRYSHHAAIPAGASLFARCDLLMFQMSNYLN
jgi:hypothetical protein